MPMLINKKLHLFNFKVLLIATSLFSVLVFSEVSTASLKNDVKSAFQDMTSMRNSTRAGVYKSQTAMHYSGGSYMERYPIRDYQIFSMQGPKFEAGCGGIDLTLGGFSHINSDEIKQMMANIAANSKGLVYKLGIDIVSAQLGGVISEMERIAAAMNELNINSCEAAEFLVGGAVEIAKTGEMGCVKQKMSSGNISNYLEAVKACRAGSQPDSTDPSKMDEATSGTPMWGNLVWRSMAKTNLFGVNGKTDEYTMRYVLMAMTGTALRKTESPIWNEWVGPSYGEDAMVVHHWGGMSDAKLGEALNSFMYGGKVEMLECHKVHNSAAEARDNFLDCAGVKEGKATIGANDAFYNQVDAALKQLIEGMAEDKALGEEQQHLLSSTSLPIWALLASAHAAGGTNLAHSYRAYLSEIIAREYMHNFLTSMIGEVKKVINEGDSIVIDDELQRITANIDKVMEKLRQMQQKHQNSQDHVYKLLAQHDAYKKVVISRIPTNLDVQKLPNSGY